MIKIVVVTSSRADYGLLKTILKRLEEDSYFKLYLVVTGSHLSELYGSTVEDIRKDQFSVYCSISMSSKEKVDFGVSELSLGISECFSQITPDCLMILGDRYEMLTVALSATLYNIPIIHLCGGDISEGAFDDSIRHAITKLSHLHFPSNAKAAQRLQQMGEAKERIFQYGSPGLDLIRQVDCTKWQDILCEIGIKNTTVPFYLTTFHPVTLKEDKGLSELENLLQAFCKHNKKFLFNVIFTGVNMDPGADLIEKKILSFCRAHNNFFYVQSLGSEKYISLMKNSVAIVGNSSSGFYEAPFLKKPTVNIGTRQAGRLGGGSIFNATTVEEILDTFHNIDKVNLESIESPYGEGNASENIVRTLKSVASFKTLLTKKFIDL